MVPDFEAEVTGMMQYIKPDYESERGIRTVKINHCDGCGMGLPGTVNGNFMVRLPWIKGLLTEFDYLKWCDEHHVEPVVTDFWGKIHNLREENITVIFTVSQFKLAKYYASWEEYCDKFEQYNCHCCATNFEEDRIPDTEINYQFIQSLTEMTDNEIESFTRRSKERLTSITSTVPGMLDLLGCNRPMLTDSLCAIKMYPALLQVKQFRDTIFNCKTRLLLDCKSGAIKCRNKRLFALPDIYAWCERLFLGIENPQGILEANEIAAKEFRDQDEVDVLRSPHLYVEHAIRKVSHDSEVYRWFTTNGIYTSCHDLITRILQLDVDGDQLNVTDDPNIINAAKRTIEKYNIVPLFYDAIKAKAEIITRDTLFNGLRRAYEMGNIGTVSNGLTKIWNKDNPDIIAAACMVKYNNFVIKI